MKRPGIREYETLKELVQSKRKSVFKHNRITAYLRKKYPRVYSLRALFTFVTLGEIIISVGIAALMTQILRLIVPQIETTLLAIVLGLSTLVGIGVSVFLNRRILRPIERLSDAMEQVSKGNFKIQAETNSHVNEIVNIYDSFNMMVRELGSTEVLQTDFVSNVSHEFKTPINAIEGYTTLLQSDNLSEFERMEYLEKVMINTGRLSQLVSNMLLFAKLENNNIPLHKAGFRLDEQIRESIVVLEPKWSEKQLELNVEMEELEYVGNAAYMIHIWDNLIGNAIKFAPVGGYIGISLRKLENDRIYAIIEDNGPGIPAEQRKHIFEKFYQGDHSHKSEGNGLGLSIVRKIVENTGGEIHVEDRVGGGSRFIVEL